MLAADGLGYAVGRKRLVSNVSLELRRGEMLAVIGPNGAGKSTLLRMLAGELRPGVGSIAVDGRPLAEWPAKALARRRGVLPQSSTLSFPFAVAEVAMLGRAPHNEGMETRLDRAIVAEALAMAGVGHLAARRYPSLSGGERQRVHIARVLAQLMSGPGKYEGGYLLLDEPVTSLDPRHQHAALALARDFAAAGGAVLAILHDVNLALRYAGRFLVLAEGEVAAAGSADEALSPEVLGAVFGMPFRRIADPEGGPPILLAA